LSELRRHYHLGLVTNGTSGRSRARRARPAGVESGQRSCARAYAGSGHRQGSRCVSVRRYWELPAATPAR
jgi:hypothetical protein